MPKRRGVVVVVTIERLWLKVTLYQRYSKSIGIKGYWCACV